MNLAINARAAGPPPLGLPELVLIDVLGESGFFHLLIGNQPANPSGVEHGSKFGCLLCQPFLAEVRWNCRRDVLLFCNYMRVQCPWYCQGLQG